VGSVTVCSRSTSAIVLVEETALMLVAPLIVRVEPVAGVIVTFDAGTCTYPVKSSTGGGAVDAGVDAFPAGRRALDTTLLVVDTAPVPPVSQ
jgi:hypothetical protein